MKTIFYPWLFVIVIEIQDMMYKCWMHLTLYLGHPYKYSLLICNEICSFQSGSEQWQTKWSCDIFTPLLMYFSCSGKVDKMLLRWYVIQVIFETGSKGSQNKKEVKVRCTFLR